MYVQFKNSSVCMPLPLCRKSCFVAPALHNPLLREEREGGGGMLISALLRCTGGSAWSLPRI